ncbi:TetR/AcrR family transcriptional regulator [Rhodococcus coprophilus]|uniref:Tetr family transcriptional regulator n=1 Tax=Rhodococcus coprophilus TaxID=38310 RepID=A0A2X4TPW6_9NOCA|nr:TetR/AcrR family transcriptional regulator [Rhodococcus coprophilus]MBM7460581.1 AcrR family transcriptional regulator [Rhodococcus coprophilus]SQI28389.1 tetr family transcriptional regulator [Rhodococcus coprophilus]
MARPRKFDEQDVLTAARDAFWRGGYTATSVQDLAEATGLGAQSIYGAFGSKRDLFLRILDDYCATQKEGLESAVTADSSPWHGLTSAVVFEDGGRLKLPEQGCLMVNTIAALSAQDDDVRTRACRVYDDTLALFARQITEAQERGEIDSDVDPTETARALITVMQGIEFLQKSGIAEDEVRRLKHAALDMIERAVTKTADPEEVQP